MGGRLEQSRKSRPGHEKKIIIYKITCVGLDYTVHPGKGFQNMGQINKEKMKDKRKDEGKI
jgi:hypothetical protein